MFIAGKITSLVNIKPKLFSIDNTVFKLHYRITTWLLVFFTVILEVEQYTDNKIKCTNSDPTDSKKQLEHVINTFCFFTSTFTVADHHNLTNIKNVAGPGVGPHTKDDEIIRHRYYQWVPYVLLLQAVCFYAPHFLWKYLEGDRLKGLVDGFSITQMLDKKNKEKAHRKVLYNFEERLTIYKNWTRTYIFCEILNLVNLILQLFITDWFLNGEFLSLGQYVYQNWVDGLNPLDKVFPKTAKCSFQKFGPTGTLMTQDVLCVLFLNVINEKIFLTLWYWYFILLAASIIIVIHRILSYIFYQIYNRYNRTIFNLSMDLRADKEGLEKIMDTKAYSEWFFLENLLGNLGARLANDLIIAIAEAITVGEDKKKDRFKDNVYGPQNQSTTMPMSKDEEKGPLLPFTTAPSTPSDPYTDE